MKSCKAQIWYLSLPVWVAAQARVQAVERYAFYERVKKAYAIVVTGELEPWGNLLLRKGVLGQALRP